MGLREWLGTAERWVCTQCGYYGRPETRMRGSGLVTFLLLFMFILPALIYSAWRGSTRYKACANCGSPNVIPESSPMARQYLSR